jgi:hypothetical protein
MFTLDNQSIQYPFAVVERVPVCQYPGRARYGIHLTGHLSSMVGFLCGSYTIPDSHGVGRHSSSKPA